MSDPKTNKQLREAKWLLQVALEQQAESLASQCRAPYSRPSQQMATINGDRSDAHTLPMGGSDSDSSGNSYDRLWAQGAKHQQEWRHELSP